MFPQSLRTKKRLLAFALFGQLLTSSVPSHAMVRSAAGPSSEEIVEASVPAVAVAPAVAPESESAAPEPAASAPRGSASSQIVNPQIDLTNLSEVEPQRLLTLYEQTRVYGSSEDLRVAHQQVMEELYQRMFIGKAERRLDLPPRTLPLRQLEILLSDARRRVLGGDAFDDDEFMVASFEEEKNRHALEGHFRSPAALLPIPITFNVAEPNIVRDAPNAPALSNSLLGRSLLAARASVTEKAGPVDSADSLVLLTGESLSPAFIRSFYPGSNAALEALEAPDLLRVYDYTRQSSPQQSNGSQSEEFLVVHDLAALAFLKKIAGGTCGLRYTDSLSLEQLSEFFEVADFYEKEAVGETRERAQYCHKAKEKLAHSLYFAWFTYLYQRNAGFEALSAQKANQVRALHAGRQLELEYTQDMALDSRELFQLHAITSPSRPLKGVSSAACAYVHEKTTQAIIYRAGRDGINSVDHLLPTLLDDQLKDLLAVSRQLRSNEPERRAYFQLNAEKERRDELQRIKESQHQFAFYAGEECAFIRSQRPQAH